MTEVAAGVGEDVRPVVARDGVVGDVRVELEHALVVHGDSAGRQEREPHAQHQRKHRDEAHAAAAVPCRFPHRPHLPFSLRCGFVTALARCLPLGT